MIHGARDAFVSRACFFAGRIVNRLAYDTELMDFLLIRLHNSALASVMWLLSSIVVMAYVVPYILLILLAVGLAYIFMVVQYRRACVQLQRLDAVSRSPINVRRWLECCRVAVACAPRDPNAGTNSQVRTLHHLSSGTGTGTGPGALAHRPSCRKPWWVRRPFARFRRKDSSSTAATKPSMPTRRLVGWLLAESLSVVLTRSLRSSLPVELVSGPYMYVVVH